MFSTWSPPKTAPPPAKRTKIIHNATTATNVTKPGALKRMFESGDWSDLTIKTKDSGKTFAVHKTVLCPAWEFARAACTSGFIESKTNVIELPEDERVITAILRYYYELPFEVSKSETLSILVKLRVAIDKYGIDGLIRNVEHAFKARLEAETYPNLVVIGATVFAEAGDCMIPMQNAIAAATRGKMSEIVRDMNVWSQMQESPEFLRRTLLEILPPPPVVLSDSSSDTDSSDE
ncbi:uncharacterized protein MYCFIDRAFT_87046 [Pseudocercospora fijiensis CIRAD86]|uniref:BTB domain-containing protein n=1 Tax=Pseudocercospora fijiensis (strain CIRAD86) TaxID=383855 RepID=M2ZP99_PSEFD|nr:uncharacterized protein MYCFIDRAFT_87046 [Pseudocercospora fijiensis CIRAD86]EME80929.1 hypothetical protein MYCFIDRAFT_87046 [Pseudocercospora fijiensis CIRAD86]